jgi:hypothetical protein
MSVFLVVQLLHSGLISNGFLPIYGTAINSVMSPNNIVEADDRCFAQAKDSCIATRNFMGYSMYAETSRHSREGGLSGIRFSRVG